MKIITVIGSIDKSLGGPSRSVPQVCEKLANNDLKIEIITRPCKNPVKVNESENLKITYVGIFKSISFFFKLSKKNTSLIHLQHIWDLYIHLFALISRVKGIPYIITPRGMLEPYILERHPLRKKIAMLLYQRRDIKKAICIHASSEKEKQNIVKLDFKTNIIVIPNGIKISSITNFKEKICSYKIVFLSRIHSQKGIELLLEAWKNIDYKKWSLEIAGDGDVNYINYLKNKIIVEKIKNISITKPRYGNQKWEFLSKADIFILPSYSESFGMAIAEALFVGIPVITTKGTPWQELELNNCGWWVNLSVDDIANAINDAISKKPEELFLMGCNGRKLVVENYEISKISNRMLTLYNSLL